MGLAVEGLRHCGRSCQNPAVETAAAGPAAARRPAPTRPDTPAQAGARRKAPLRRAFTRPPAHNDVALLAVGRRPRRPPTLWITGGRCRPAPRRQGAAVSPLTTPAWGTCVPSTPQLDGLQRRACVSLHALHRQRAAHFLRVPTAPSGRAAGQRAAGSLGRRRLRRPGESRGGRGWRRRQRPARAPLRKVSLYPPSLESANAHRNPTTVIRPAKA